MDDTKTAADLFFFTPPESQDCSQHYVACMYDVILEVLLHTYMLRTETDGRQPFLFASCTNIWQAVPLGVGGHFDSKVGANIRRLFRCTFALTFVPGGHSISLFLLHLCIVYVVAFTMYSR